MTAQATMKSIVLEPKKRSDKVREFEARLVESSTLAFRVAFSVLRQREDAEDIAQEAFAKAYRSFCEIGGCLFIYGHSLAENDEHYLKRIEKGKVQHLYIGLYGDPNTDANKLIVRRADRMITARGLRRPLEVTYFDAASAHVWGK